MLVKEVKAVHWVINSDLSATTIKMYELCLAGDVNDVDRTCSRERRVHNVEINMDTFQKSGMHK